MSIERASLNASATVATASPFTRPIVSTRDYLFGCLLVVAGGVLLSCGVLAVRWANTSDTMQYLLWRSIGFSVALAIAGYLGARTPGGEARNPLAAIMGMSASSWIGAVCMVISASTFIAALRMSSVAETYLICAMAPLVSAALAWPLLRERTGVWTFAAIGLAVAGVAVMSSDGSGDSSWVGRLLALTSCVSFSGYMLANRRTRRTDLDALLLTSGLLSIAVMAGGLLLRGLPLMPDVAMEAVIAAGHGLLVLSAGLWLFARGSSYVPVVTLTMLAQIESVTSPIIAFLFLGEMPSRGVLIGGGIVLAALFLQAGDREGRRLSA